MLGRNRSSIMKGNDIGVSNFIVILTCDRLSNPYSRLRVPFYRKVFEAIFLISFLVLYYAVLMDRNLYIISTKELLLYVWIAAFAYDEFGDITDSNFTFYRMDFWSIWDLSIIGIGFTFLASSLWPFNN